MEEICIGNEHLILCEGKLKTDKTLAQTNLPTQEDVKNLCPAALHQ